MSNKTEIFFKVVKYIFAGLVVIKVTDLLYLIAVQAGRNADILQKVYDLFSKSRLMR